MLPTTTARTGYIIPTFQNNLLSLGKLCDADCTAHLDKHRLLVRDKVGNPILTGHREQTGARLWRVNISPPPPPAVNTDHVHDLRPPTTVQDNCQPTPTPQHQPRTPPSRTTRTTMHSRAYDLPSVPALISYLHACAGYPVKATWYAAVKRGAYTSWPGLTPGLVARYCPEAPETTLGHMTQPKQHIRSTKRQPQPLPIPLTTKPPPPTLTLHEFPLNTIFTDDTGRFHPRARSGNQYIMVALHSQTNAILIRPFASKHDTHRIPAYQALYMRLSDVGAAPTLHVMDNEASTAFQRAVTSNKCKLQLVPPHVHRRNAAERAIRTFKAHFLSILAGTAPSFPADRWDLLLPHAELTLNLLRPAATGPAPSAWEALFGHFNFDATPLGPAGCAIHIHTKPAIRRSWDMRAKDGFYIGPALSHYRCYRVLTKETKTITISDAVKFRPHNVPSPTITPEDKIIRALHDINTTLKRAPTGPSDNQQTAIDTLCTILQSFNAQTPTDPAPNPPTPPGVQRLPPHPVTPPSNTTSTLPAAPPGVPTQDTPSPPPHTSADEWTTVPTRHCRQPTTSNDEPVATRTRARLTQAINPFAALADDDPANITNATACPVLEAATGNLLEHRQLRRHPEYKATWDTSYSNELGRLCQGVGTDPSDPTKQRVKGTDTFQPIHYQNIPPERRQDITYTRVVCEVRPQKEDPNRTRITIGGNRICYSGDTATRTGSLELVKLQLNSTISTPDARFACFDISNFYLGTPLDRPEYVRINIKDIPHEFIDEYNLHHYTYNGWVYFEINKAVYGLKQAGKLANDLLTERLAEHGYYQCTLTPGLWRHKWRPISFVLIVDDFGIKYVGKRHAQHLLAALQSHYNVTTDWTGAKFAGIDIAWDYAAQQCRITMNGYIKDLLTKYNHPHPKKPQHSPHAHIPIVYGAKEQLLPDIDTSPPLDAAGVKRIQGIIGSLLYYARAVDNKLLATLGTISSQQATATENTAKAVHQLLDYVATYPNDGITYRASAMILAAHSDASYLTETGSRSRAGAHIFLSEDDPMPRNNGPVLSISQLIKFVMASAAEAELAALYTTAREMIPLRNALDEMGWKQPRSPVQTDNSTANGFIQDTIIQRRIKMIWMRLHWLRCRAAQGQFRFYWNRSATNMADYHTKHHPPAYHLAHRATHVG